MRRSKTVRGLAEKTTACLLIVCLLAGGVGLTAYAEPADQDTTLAVNEAQGTVEAGNITIDVENNDAVGVEVKASSGTGGGTQVQTGDISVTVKGDDGFWYDGYGVHLREGENASNTLDLGNIDVSVTVEEEMAAAFGMKVECAGGGHQTTVNTGSVTVTASGDEYGNAVGLDLYSTTIEEGDGSSLEIAVDGDITVHNDLTTAQGVKVFNNEGADNQVRITVNGDITATMDTDDDSELAEGMALTTAGSGNSTEVVVDGDVTADRRGLMIVTEDDGTLDLVVTGTISGRDVGIGLDGDLNADNTSITTWKIESDGALVDDVFGTLGAEGVTDIAKEAIHYIVKLVQPEQGDVLEAVKADGSALATKTFKVSEDTGEQTVSTQTEGEIVRLTLNDDRYEIVSAENVDGTALSKDDQGFFYTVTRGGGILLSAIIREKFSSEPEPQPEPEPKPQPQPSEDADSAGGERARGIRIVYELDGGFYEDEPGPIIRYCMPGQLIHLLDEPEKEGFEFGGWYRVINDQIEIHEANEEYRPRTSVTFTAIWNEK